MTARDPSFVTMLRETIEGEVLAEVPLARFSTFRIGGPATMVLPAGADGVETALSLARRSGIPWFILGLGSNVLLPDSGLEALVIRLGKGMDRVRHEQERWWFGAGLPAPLAARRTAAAGFAGLHKMVGVPGTVGGGVYMNAGCHGVEWSEVITRVTVMDEAGHATVLEHSAIPFTYRWSGLDRRIVLEAEVSLTEADPEVLRRETNELFRWRQEGTPFNQPCCGSTFKNPELPPGGHESGLSTAGQFLDAAGLKGYTVGGVQVSPMHANYFVNVGGGTAADVRTLIDHARHVVAERFGVTLETEVKLVAPDGRYEQTPPR
ncbi:MAG: UDP-N-acetylmuramate dehydrogenase [Gemmatimonadales bacterium]|nr:UDP-N-acetylmuramate dehydrogenase [Gemmatimonadales bacterium]